MPDNAQPIATYVHLLKNTKLNAYTRDQLEYILYQLNLAMLKVERSPGNSAELPCKREEIALLNRLIIAAAKGNSLAATKELGDKMSRIIAGFAH